MMTWVKRGNREIPRFHAIYMGRVLDNNDPEKQGKCKLSIPVVLGNAPSCWALPKNISTGNGTGFFDIPQIGATVWVTFIDGNCSRPVYETGHPIAPLGSSGPQIPQEALEDYPNTSVFKTSAGHKIVFNNKNGKRKLTIKSSTGMSVTLDDQANLMSIIAPHISIGPQGGPNIVIGEGSGEYALIRVIDLNTLLSWLASHEHTGVQSGGAMSGAPSSSPPTITGSPDATAGG